MRPLTNALLAQLGGGILALGLTRLLPELWQVPLGLAAIQGGCAAIVARARHAPLWWVLIHIGFLPAIILASRLNLPPAWYLAGFAALALVYWRADRNQVPLYLSNTRTAAAVASLLPPGPCWVADLGCGHGGLLRRLARQRPDCEFVGIEHAPLPWLWARLAALDLGNCRIRYGNFWRQPLGAFDFVYVFLSPAPMAELWNKAGTEMKPGSLLVSNSFPVPDITPLDVVAIPDRRHTHLYCYRPAG